MKIVPYTADQAEDGLRLLNLLRAAPLTLSDFLAREARWPPDDLRLRWLGFERERAVALGQIAISPYAPTDHLAVLVSVDPDRRNSGRGSGMLDLLEDEATMRGYRGLVATIPEAASGLQAWAGARGFRRHALHCDSLLHLRTCNGRESVIASVRLSDMTGGSPAQWQEVAALLQRLVSDAPDMRDLPPWSEARCLSVLRDTPVARPEWVIVARSHGTPIGLTVGHALGEEAYSFFTGVLPDWRGRHVGLALKQRLIAAVRAKGITTMRATNLDTNMPALRLNVSLGFRPVPGSLELRKTLPSAHPEKPRHRS